MLRSDLIDDFKPTLLSQILREHFADGSPDAIALVEAGALYVTLEPGEILLRQGESGDDVYFVLSGRLRAQKEGPGEAPVVLGEIGRGEPVGELAMFTGEARSASVVALRRTIVARISRDLLERAIAHRPEMALKLTRRVIERFRARDELRRPPSVPVTVCILPITPGVDAAQLARALRSQQPAQLGQWSTRAQRHGELLDSRCVAARSHRREPHVRRRDVQQLTCRRDGADGSGQNHRCRCDERQRAAA